MFADVLRNFVYLLCILPKKYIFITSPTSFSNINWKVKAHLMGDYSPGVNGNLDH